MSKDADILMISGAVHDDIGPVVTFVAQTERGRVMLAACDAPDGSYIIEAEFAAIMVSAVQSAGLLLENGHTSLSDEELRRGQIRTLIELEASESECWDKGQDAAAIDFRKRAIALRNFLALTNFTVPESPDEEARRIEDAQKPFRIWQGGQP